MRKSFIIIFLTAAICLSLAGCSNPGAVTVVAGGDPMNGVPVDPDTDPVFPPDHIPEIRPADPPDGDVIETGENVGGESGNRADSPRVWEKKPEPADGDFVSVFDYIPDIFVELKYATEDNITGKVIYDFTTAYLRYGTVKKLMDAQKRLAATGYSLKIWDAFRPVSAQYLLWEAVPDARYIANPNTGYSNHSRGNCIDVTLVMQSGKGIEMPTGFDDFSLRADTNYSDVSELAATHATMLQNAMKEAGFKPYSAEWWHFTDSDSHGVDESFSPRDEEDSRGDIEITISAVGDCILAMGYGYNYERSFEYYARELGNDYSYFFAGVYDVLADDDLTIANAESVFTNSEKRVDKSHQGTRGFWFKSIPDYAKIYKAGSVEAVNVANNHSHDYGEEGFLESVASLKSAGVTTFGYGEHAIVYRKGIRICLLGYNLLGPLEFGVNEELIKEEIAADFDRLKDEADIFIVSFHWGEEYETRANAKQERLGRFAVDCGADLVLGHHSHTVQNIETYKGKQIVYSLGNFVYGGAVKPIKDTIIFRQTFKISRSGEIAGSSHEVVEAYVYGNTERNNYQPVLK